MPDILDSLSPRLNITIRPVCRDDLRKLEWFGLLTPFRDTIERAYARAERGDIAFLVADLNRFPIGQVWVDLVAHAEERIGVIQALRVIEPLRNLGVGTRLIQAAERVIIEHGLRTAEISVEKTNPQARRLYERLGYRVHHDDGAGNHRGETHEWVLRKRTLAVSH